MVQRQKGHNGTGENSSPIYQGYYGDFTITPEDCRGVLVYRSGLAIAAICWLFGLGCVGLNGPGGVMVQLLTPLFFIFCSAIGVSLVTIHIYLRPLHRTLQGCWIIGTIAAIAVTLSDPEPLILTVYHHPVTLWGVGWLFVALTGIYFKEGFCFRRIETMVLTPLVPLLLLSHLLGTLPPQVGQVGLGLWGVLFIIFALRKFSQDPADDIGDKSVFMHLNTGQ